MFYRDFQELKLSALGMGNMRLPTVGGDPRGAIDERAAQAIIERVYERGVNYFDTAYMYHGGESERFLGRALARLPKNSFYLADKMTVHPIVAGERNVEQIFTDQLERCNTDHFEFYLLHNVSEPTVDDFMKKEYGVLPYLLEQKKKGRIRHLGFSNHGRPETLRRMLEYGNGCFEFVQMQLNYLDWALIDAKSVYDEIRAAGLPVWVMEPCRGGRLASLSPEAEAILRAARPDRSVASWAFRWLMGLDGMGVILSGMSNMEQAEDNLATFGAPDPLPEAEREALDSALHALSAMGAPCTGCRYCDGCPVGLDIPEILARYNEWKIIGGKGALMKLSHLPEGRGPADCIACGACTGKCPQGIGVPDVMQALAEAMQTL